MITPVLSTALSCFPQLANADSTTATFRFHGEDHTLGNSLRYILAKSPSTDFVGYSIPHPSEHVINFRLQTRKGKHVQAVMAEACTTLEALCDHILDTFTEAEERAVREGRDKGEEDDDDVAGAEDHQMEEID